MKRCCAFASIPRPRRKVSPQQPNEPLIYRCFDGEFRKAKVGNFRYALVFRVRGDEIQVIAVMHMSRRPGYWKERRENWL